MPVNYHIHKLIFFSMHLYVLKFININSRFISPSRNQGNCSQHLNGALANISSRQCLPESCIRSVKPSHSLISDCVQLHRCGSTLNDLSSPRTNKLEIAREDGWHTTKRCDCWQFLSQRLGYQYILRDSVQSREEKVFGRN